jgi:tetratricopeptide (TPR) repeat protein
VLSLNALSEIANAYYFQGQLDDALHLFQVGEQWLSAKETQPVDQMSFLLKYGQFLIYYYFLTNREEDSMLFIVQRARQIAGALQNEVGIATACYLVGQTLYYHNLLTSGSDYSEARGYFGRALTLSEKAGESRIFAESLFYIGVTYERHDKETQAADYYRRALASAEQHGHTWAASEAYRHLSGLSMSIDTTQSLEYALRSLALREEMGFKRGLPPAQLLVSDVYIARNDLAHALEYCQQAEQLATEMGLHIYLADAHLTRGDIAYSHGKRAEARTHFEKAAAIARELNNTFVVVEANAKLNLLAGEETQS